MESERGATGARVDKVVGLLVLGTDAVAVAGVVACVSALSSRAIWYKISGGEI